MTDEPIVKITFGAIGIFAYTETYTCACAAFSVWHADRNKVTNSKVGSNLVFMSLIIKKLNKSFVPLTQENDKRLMRSV
jgi:hypothetical protein